LRRAQPGDVVLILSEQDRKHFIRTLTPGGRLQTHRGILYHDDLIDQPLGGKVKTHLGFSYHLLLPTTEELIRYLKRSSQIIFPKDSGYLILRLGIKPGTRVIEAGTGSGGFCLALATFVGDGGHVYSYDNRLDMQELARLNIGRAALSGRVTFINRDIAEGFEQTDVDALFLDMLSPWEYLDQAREALRGSGVLGCLVPTVNQLSHIIGSLTAHPGFGFVEAEELILRQYKTVPARVRPEDRIVGHTGYMIFARAVVPPQEDAAGSVDNSQNYVDEI